MGFGCGYCTVGLLIHCFSLTVVCLQVQLPPNPYNRGFWANLHEVLWWEWHLQRATAAVPAAIAVVPAAAAAAVEAASEDTTRVLHAHNAAGRAVATVDGQDPPRRRQRKAGA